jgi:hypothetical protein
MSLWDQISAALILMSVCAVVAARLYYRTILALNRRLRRLERRLESVEFDLDSIAALMSERSSEHGKQQRQ